MSYVSEICRGYKKLTKSQELSLILQGDVRAKQMLIMSVIPLIVRMARRFSYSTGLALADLVHEGILGAYRSMLEFNPNEGIRWSSFAMNKGQVLAYMQAFINGSELIERSVKDKKEKLHYSISSLDQPVTEDGSTLAEIVADESADDPSDINVIDMSGTNFDAIINRLPEGECKTALKLFAKGMSCREVGKLRGYSGQNAINNKDKAIHQLRKILKKEGVLV